MAADAEIGERVPAHADVKRGQDAAFGRRKILRAIGASVVAGASASFRLEARAATETTDEQRKPRYRQSEHVKIYYRVNGYPI